ncbi:hypothetical protein [Spirosoma luteum]|uniref:hypothetical protein n=1 Tax=Spirosoma luteum TaxID=431553 RepID=UPI00035D2840|nr:hypothetical protein [Spirosoma luteum]
MAKRLLTSVFMTLALAGLLACSHLDVLQPVTRSTDQIARIREWLVTRPAVTNQSSVDSLRNLKLEDGYHFVEYAWSSTFTYDARERLIAEDMDGYRDSGDYGIEKKKVAYRYSYQPDELVATQTTTFGGNYRSETSQHLSLNQQGRVAAAPLLAGLGYWGQYSMSQLVKDAVMPFAKDVLRTYNAEGLLIKTQSDLVAAPPELFRTVRVQQVDKGNVTSVQIQRLDKNLTTTATSAPVVVESIRYTYDPAKPGFRSPYQFMGVTNRNLIVQSVRHVATGGADQISDYQYEFDDKGRVKHYIIRNSVYDTIVGDITYVQP